MSDFDKNNKIRRRNVNDTRLETSYNQTNKKNTTSTTKRTSTSKKKSKSRKKRRRSKINKKRITKTLLVLFLVILTIVAIPTSILAYTTLKDSPILTEEIIKDAYISSEVAKSEDIPIELK